MTYTQLDGIQHHHTGCKSGHSRHQHTGYDTQHHHTGYGIYNIITPAAKAAIPAINTPAVTHSTSSYRLQKQSYLITITLATTHSTSSHHHTGCKSSHINNQHTGYDTHYIITLANN
ncbi:hypothetical protein ACLKA6_012853 [Drosophila palustris]